MEHEWEGRWPNVHGSARNFFRLMIYWKYLCLLDGKVGQESFEVHPNLAATCLSENYEIPKFGWLRNLGISNFPTNPHLPASISGFLSFCSASICSVKLLVSGQRHPLLKGAFRQPCLPRSLWRLLWSNWRTLFIENMMWLFLIHLNSIESTCHIFLISPSQRYFNLHMCRISSMESSRTIQTTELQGYLQQAFCTLAHASAPVVAGSKKLADWRVSRKMI